jgi:diguanylate cyclase (GGDEF)-like protein
MTSDVSRHKTIHPHMTTTHAPNAGNWLCPTESDRARLEDMTRRLFPASVAVVVACMPLVVLLTLRVGAVFAAPYLLAAFVIVAIGTILRSQASPEYWFFASDIAVVCAIAAAVALTGGTQSPMLPLLVVSIVAGAGRNTQRGLFVYAVVIVIASALACQFAVNRSMNYADLRFVGYLTAIVSTAILVITLTRAEREYREHSLVDALTGTLNRFALARTLEEIRVQVRLGDGQLCAIAADIDHFKHINDTHGHEAGDTVLRGVASALRSQLRSFPLLYRTGGEEFLAILPGLNCAEGERIAERLRSAVAAARPSSIQVTMSFGVAATCVSGSDPDVIVSAADRCLYRAKESGRNRVVAEAEHHVAWLAQLATA